MNSLNCIIVDDDEMDRLIVVSYAKRFEKLNIIGVFDSAEKVLKFLETNTIDVAFLDIELQKSTGLELREKTMQIPVCVFISSHTELAAETFEINTLDFIVKPYKFPRFEQTVNRIFEYMELKNNANLFEASIDGGTFYIKVGTEQIKIKLHDILYFEALKNYTIVVTKSNRYSVLTNIGDLLKNKIFENFIRIHRSYAIQKKYILRFK
jgi:two-component system, LytTR family, response regulator